MRSLLVPINALFDFALWPFRSSRPMIPLALVSLLTAILLLFVFRYTSNQLAIRRAKDLLEAHVLEVRLFQEQLRVVLRAYLCVLLGVLNYLRHSMRPLAVTAIPLLIIIVQLNGYFDWTPNHVGSEFLLKARLADSAPLDLVDVQVPAGLAVTAPAVHILQEREVDWRLKAERSGNFSVAVLVSGAPFSKQVIVSDQLVRVSRERSRASWLEEFLNPGEEQLPRNAPIESIEVQYPPRSFHLWSFAIDWVIIYLALSLILGFALKGVFGVEI
jgi:hypothetical protein